jgi:hypothetical protein
MIQSSTVYRRRHGNAQSLMFRLMGAASSGPSTRGRKSWRLINSDDGDYSPLRLVLQDAGGCYKRRKIV